MPELVVCGVVDLISARAGEVQHPNREQGLHLCMGMTFATLAHQIQMRGIDRPDMVEFTEALIQMMLRFMGIADVPVAETSDNT